MNAPVIPSLKTVFPFTYQGCGYFRLNGVPKGESAPILHGEQAIEAVFTQTVLAMKGWKPKECKTYLEDPTVAYDEGESKGQCAHCGDKWYEHADQALPPKEKENLVALMEIRVFQMGETNKTN